MTDTAKVCAWLDQVPVATVDPLNLPEFIRAEVEVGLVRLDQIGEGLSGNKWYKLKYNLQFALQHGYRRILSFGGAYSNHLHALAWAGNRIGLETVGIIRGEPEYGQNPTLTDAKRWGMQCVFVDRQTYRLRHDPEYLKSLQALYPDCWIVPEGGSNTLALQGCAEILNQNMLRDWQPDAVVLACGTGGTLAGLAAAYPDQRFLGIPVLQNAGFLNNTIQALLDSRGQRTDAEWALDLGGAFGGYGKTTEELRAFMTEFQCLTGITLDGIYTSKMLLRLIQLVEAGRFQPGSKILALHTGGLQGNRGLKPR